MAHWIDEVAKGFATGTLSRRDVLASCLRTGVAAAGTSLFGGMGLVGTAFAQPVKRGDCSIRISGTQRIRSFSVVQGGVTLQQETSFDRVNKTAASRIVITRGKNVVAKLDVHVANDGAQKATASYGLGVRGVSNAELTVQDGKTVQGTMDGRPLVPFPAADAPRSTSAVRFADGRPPPQITVDPEVTRAIPTLLKKAQVAAHSCSRPPRPLLQNRGAGNEHPPGSHDGSLCDQCESKCGDSYETCWIDNIADFFCPPCAVVAVGSCLVFYGGCVGNCYLPGNGCCPVLCGTPVVDNCCGDGETCMEEHHQCCPKGRVVCGNECCDLGIGNCAPDGSCGCPTDSVKCGNVCCKVGSTCCEGQCCPSNVPCINGMCCEAPMQVCGGGCCAPLTKCCNGVCCGDNNDICTSGPNSVCCSRGQACGSRCCPPGQVCNDANAGTCRASDCPPGQVHTQCATEHGAPTSVCCPPNALCCAGQCCQPGLLCCKDPFTNVLQCSSNCLH